MEEQLKIVIVGHVDHGKSTLVGRLMHDTGSLMEGKLEQLQAVAERRGVPFEWANLMDALQAERDQNITIDTTQIWFKTQKRQYVIIDAPGHREFLKNMITGAANAQAALLMIDATEGVREQSRQHGYLLQLLGIRQIAVVINKMDRVEWSEDRFHEIEREYREFLRELEIVPSFFVPVSAREGVNIAGSNGEMPWWNGPTVVEVLDWFNTDPPAEDQALRFVVQDVYRFDHRRILGGRIESGRVEVGDRLLFSPGNKVSTVKSIERWSAPETTSAGVGESIGITLSEQLFVERGAIASKESEPPFELNRLKAKMFWLGREPLREGRQYKLKLATQELDCRVDRIEKVVDATSLTDVTRKDDPRVERHEVAELHFRFNRPVVFDLHDEHAATGRFVLVDKLEVSGGGIIVNDDYPHRTSDGFHKSTNIFWSEGKVMSEQREHRNGHPGAIVWLTGLSGAGKSTVAVELERHLFAQGRHVYVLDGDKVRHGLCNDLGFAPEDRNENIRRVGEVAKLMADAGMITIAAFISPYRADRDLVRGIMLEGRFVEVHVDAPLEVCEERDPKGLYAKARSGVIKEFTGISAPYEAPVSPEVTLRTDLQTVEECVESIVNRLCRIDGRGQS
jgi:bifunctional enzyme CysN/CysC